jgi:hypothetical protein
VSIAVARCQEHLKKQQAGGPDSGTAAEPGQDAFGDERLDKEQQKGAGKECGGIKNHERSSE